ncbi:MAG: CHRD domain-containing protein [Chloroflexi bacterium]|nr:CHRD domain-containing protein [Chloroflexota bacterium]
MKAQNNSGQDGKVTLTVQGDRTRVVIDIRPGAAGLAQPAHVHEGTCASLGKVAFPLKSVENGKSDSVVDVSLATLQSRQFAVNVHKSTQEIAIATSCGDTGPAALATTALPRTGGPSLILLALVGGMLAGTGLVLRPSCRAPDPAAASGGRPACGSGRTSRCPIRRRT